MILNIKYMKRKSFLLLAIITALSIHAESEFSLKRYYETNILKLNSIEGVYDVEMRMRYLTPYVDQNGKEYRTYYIKKEGDIYIIYFQTDGFIEKSNIYLTQIGSTNAYFYHWPDLDIHERFILNNEIQFSVTTLLSHSAAKKVTKNPNLATCVNIYITDNAIKKFPTSSMYLEAAQEDAKKAEQELQKVIEETQKKAGWSGSGFALNHGYVVTNFHVIEDAKTILIKGVKGDFNTELHATVIATDKANDLAVIKIDDERFQGFGTIPYKIKRTMSEVGESVWALGYPMTDIMGEEVKFTDGKISSRTGIKGDMSVYQISVPIQPGNSGGALFDNYGNIVGITSAGLNREEFYSENVNYAIKTSYLYNLIESSLSSSIFPQGTSMKDQPLTQKIKLAKNFVFIILCSTSLDFHTGNSPTQRNDEEIRQPHNSNREILSNGNIVIKNPTCRNNSHLTITKVTLTEVGTSIEFKWQNTEYYGGWCNIDRNAYLKDSTGKTYKLKFAENISYAPIQDAVPLGSVKIFSLYFEKLPDDIDMFDFIENYSSDWKIFDINIK